MVVSVCFMENMITEPRLEDGEDVSQAGNWGKRSHREDTGKN